MIIAFILFVVLLILAPTGFLFDVNKIGKRKYYYVFNQLVYVSQTKVGD